jgi:hypothetical protein
MLEWRNRIKDHGITYLTLMTKAIVTAKWRLAKSWGLGKLKVLGRSIATEPISWRTTVFLP